MTLAVFLFSTTEGWSLPAYLGSYNKNTWTNCLGTYTSAKGRVLEGIWEDGQFKYARKGPPPVTVKRSPPPQARERQAEQKRQTEQWRQAEAWRKYEKKRLRLKRERIDAINRQTEAIRKQNTALPIQPRLVIPPSRSTYVDPLVRCGREGRCR